MRTLLLFIFCLLFSVGTSAQTFTVSGKVTDKVTGEPLIGATVQCTQDKQLHATRTNTKGQYTLKLSNKSNVSLKCSYVGYTEQSKMVNCMNDKSETANFSMVSKTATLKNVDVVSKPMKVKLDTITFDAAKYKTNDDANMLDLILKFQGVSLQDNTLKYNGEQIKEIQINGKAMTGQDVMYAVKNIQARYASKVDIFDKRNEHDEFLDIDQGNTVKAMNIITKNESEISAKTYAGGGTDHRYKLYGAGNWRHKSTQAMIFTQWNNLNEQNFSTIDLLSATGTASSSAPSQSPYAKGKVDASFHPTNSDDQSAMMTGVSEYGVTSTKAAGASFSDDWAKGKMKFAGNYVFNSSINDTDYDIFDEYFGDEENGKPANDNKQEQLVNNKNLNHRFTGKYEYYISPMDYLLVRPSFTVQKKKERSQLTDWTVKNDTTDLLLTQDTRTDQSVLSNSDQLLFIHKFKRGNAISADTRFSYVYTSEDINMDFNNVQAEDVALQQTGSYNIQKTYTATASYLQPVGRDINIKADAGWNMTYGVVKRKTLIKANEAETFSPDSTLSGSTWNEFGGMLANLSMIYSNKKRFNLNVGTEFHEYYMFTRNDRENKRYDYHTLLPYAFMRYRFNDSKSQFITEYRTEQRFPGLLQLQDALNNSNAIMAIRGNNRLKAAYHHKLMLRLQAPNERRATMFAAFLNVETADDYLGTRRSLSSESFSDDAVDDRRNSEVFSYINTDGYWAASSLLAYGFPIAISRRDTTTNIGTRKAAQAKLNVNLSTIVSYSHQPGYWDKDKVFNDQWTWNTYLTTASNISTDVDFIVDLNAKYTSSRNRTFSNMDVDYWALSYGGQLNLQPWRPLKIVLEAGHTSYIGSGTSQFNALISNASVGYKFMRYAVGDSYHAELRLEVHDIFGQDNNFYQTTTELYRREVKTNLLKRYAMLTFTYNFN